MVWVEPKIIHQVGKREQSILLLILKVLKGSGIGGNFEYIKKKGLPNYQNMTCTRELKERPITSFARSIGWKHKDYKTAIGIRADEIDRISKNMEKTKFILSLELKRTTKKRY